MGPGLEHLDKLWSEAEEFMETDKKSSERPWQKLTDRNEQKFLDSSFNMAEESSKAKTTAQSLNLTII